MSADNYLYVDALGDGRFGLFDCFASDTNPRHRNRPFATFGTADAAIKAAHKAERDGFYEYGVHIANRVLEE